VSRETRSLTTRLQAKWAVTGQESAENVIVIVLVALSALVFVSFYGRKVGEAFYCAGESIARGEGIALTCSDRVSAKEALPSGVLPDLPRTGGPVPELEIEEFAAKRSGPAASAAGRSSKATVKLEGLLEEPLPISGISLGTLPSDSRRTIDLNKVTITAPADAVTAPVFKAAMTNKRIPKAVIDLPGGAYTLTDVIVAGVSYSPDGKTASIILDVRKMEVKQKGGADARP
jgi:hypothetical protein